jgi:hypothetical protein
MTSTTTHASGARRQRHPRLLAVSTWLGAGAVTLGVGAALAGATGVAQADTGTHHATGASSSSKSDAGPKASKKAHLSAAPTAARTAGSAPVIRAAAATKSSTSPGTGAAGAVNALVTLSGAASEKRKAAAAPSNAADTSTQTVQTPFGPITITSSATAPDPGTSGPIDFSAVATTPIGKANFSLGGSVVFAATQTSVSNTIQFTSGKLVVSPVMSLILSAAGSLVTGGLAVVHSGETLMAQVKSGDLLGAAATLVTAGLTFENAVLFGHQTIDLPLPLSGITDGTDATAPNIIVHIPFGGIYSAVGPLRVTVPDYTATDETGTYTVHLVGSDVAFTGTQFGGIVPAFLKTIGIG